MNQIKFYLAIDRRKRVNINLRVGTAIQTKTMIFAQRNFPSALVLSVAIAASLFCWMTEHTHALQEKSGRVQKTQVRREHGLDHWDSDTLAYYLDNYPGYDQAVMFYASWDTNSHQLAPYWNQIAHDMDAGSSQSKMVMVSTASHDAV